MSSDLRSVLCCGGMFCAPFWAGWLAALWWRNRIVSYGWPGAILPRFIRDR
jgi:hypothetical protein